jgi:hypothetical protein
MRVEVEGDRQQAVIVETNDSIADRVVDKFFPRHTMKGPGEELFAT